MRTKRRLYAADSSSRSTGEIDLRAKFDEIVYGGNGKVPHGKWVLLRRPNRDEDGVPVPCTCLNSLSRDASPGCPYCLGEGFIWSEDWNKVYSMYIGADGGMTRRSIKLPPGILSVEYKVFYMRYDCGVRKGDKLVEVVLDQEGKIVEPLQRKTIYYIETVDDQRSDDGRIEFYAVYCREEDAIRSDYV